MKTPMWWYRTWAWYAYCSLRDSYIAYRFGIPALEALRALTHDIRRAPVKEER